MVWSLLDNFEWACGYRPRFGLIYTDYATQRRYVKQSGRLFQRIILANGVDEEWHAGPRWRHDTAKVKQHPLGASSVRTGSLSEAAEK